MPGAFWMFLSFLQAPAPVVPANSKPLKIDASVVKEIYQTRNFSHGRPNGFQWSPDGSRLYFLRTPPDGQGAALFAMNVKATGADQPVELVSGASLLKGEEEKLSAEEKARRERMRVMAKGLASFQLSPDGAKIIVPYSGKLFLVDATTGNATPVALTATPVIDPKFSPDSKSIAFVRDHNLFVFDLASAKEKAMTKGGTADKPFGEAEFVAQEEMARFTGYWWSPDSSRLLCQETDQSMVENWTLSDPASPGGAPQTWRYPRPGKANAVVGLRLIDLAHPDRPIPVTWDKKTYPYLGSARWEKNAQAPVLTVQSRDQKRLGLLRVDPVQGQTSIFFEATDTAWVSLHQEIPRFLPDGSFLWMMEKDPGNLLEVRNAQGNVVRTLVGPELGLRNLIWVGKTEAIVTAETDPARLALYRVKLDGSSPPERIEPKPGRQSGVFSSDGTRVVLGGEDLKSYWPFEIREGGKSLGVVPSVSRALPYQPNVERARVGVNGLETLIVRPKNFVKVMRYPVLVCVYGGPTHQQVLDSVGNRMLEQWYADQGFIVVNIDNRGTPGRGRAWEKTAYGQFTKIPLEDQVAGIQALCAKYPEMDPERIGIYGWSFGGTMSALAALQAPEVFRAAVAGAPVTDWLDYDTHYTERYLGVPDPSQSSHPVNDVYARNGLLDQVGKSISPLLLVHGTVDDNVFFRHTLRLSDKIQRAGLEANVLPLAGFTHMVSDPTVRASLQVRMLKFFKEHLGAPKANLPKDTGSGR